MITGGLREGLAELTKSEMLQIAAELIERARRADEEDDGGEGPGVVDWSQFRGLLKHGPDPLEYQRAIRAEWDGRP